MRLPDAVSRFVRLAGPEPNAVQREMAEYAEENGFPIIGPEVGGLLRVLARLAGARRAFEMGSGFGYSASWLAGALPADGRIVLTEYDEDELGMARDFFDRLGYADRARFEAGDALEAVERHDGPFDAVLIDHEKSRYAEGFEAVRGKVAPDGFVVADNLMHGPAAFEDVLAGVEGEPPADDAARGLVEYLGRVRDDPAFETVVVPMGNGVALSVKQG